MSINTTDLTPMEDSALKETESCKAPKDNASEPTPSGKGKSSPGNGKTVSRRGGTFRPIILCLAFALLMVSLPLQAQFFGNIEQGVSYTDNAFQLSEYDLERNEQAHPDLDFVNSADDVILKTKLFAAYDTHIRWWLIQPSFQLSGTRYILNSEKQRLDLAAGLKVSRRFGSLDLSYAYCPEVYLRNYTDTDGTDASEQFSYARNLYKAELELKPFKPSTVNLSYSLEEQFYNEFFTEFDGDVTTWTLGWRQSLPVFYADLSYAFKAYETDGAQTDLPEDASYESNIYKAGILIKKMQVDSRYPSVTWRPELDLQFEERFYSGGDLLHRGRTDNINTTSAYLHFYFGEDWNFNLDYSHIFRNIDAVSSEVRKYKEYTESRLGLNLRYQF